MGDAVQIDKNLFHDRLSAFLTRWKNDKRSGDVLFGGVSSIVIIMGKSDEAGSFHKTGAMQLWLLGYEFPATLMLLTTEKCIFVTTKKKAAYLETLKGGKVDIEILVRGGRDALDENTKQMERCAEIIKNAGKKVGILQKVVAAGPFVDEWNKAYDGVKSGLEEVDIAAALSAAALASKDSRELKYIRDASKATSGLMKDFLVEEMSDILDEEKKISHKTLSDKIMNKIDDNKYFTGTLKMAADFDPAQLDWAYPPTIMSGGNYDVKLNTQPDEKNLHAGVIIASLGFKYNSYASLCSRTFLIDPNKSQESSYKALVAAHDVAIAAVKEGTTAKAVYEKALAALKAKKPELEKHFTKNIGWGIGLENKDATLILGPKNDRVLSDGMTFTICTGIENVDNPNPQDKRSNSYSMLLSDTVRVSPEAPIVFTKSAGYDLDSVVFTFKDEEEEKPEKKQKPRAAAVSSQNVTKSRTRGERVTNQDAEKEAARREHQKELHGKKQAQGLERYGKGTGSLNGTDEKKFKTFDSYKRDNQFPSRVKDMIICVDARASSIVVPVFGRPVPFHINTIKNASRTDEGEFTYLRINFLSPGQGVGRKDGDQPFEDPNTHFVRSLTFRSKDTDRMEDIMVQIMDLKKQSIRKEQEKKQMEDVVEQDKIIEARGGGQGQRRMDQVFLRPGLEGKRLPGSITIQQNGLQYLHPTGQKVDVLFSNVKHLFFQPCDHELIVILHVHLINPILIGKKKTKDVQFYKEATANAFDETGSRKRKHRNGDEDEFEQEQQERRERARHNKDMKAFAERITDAGRSENLSVDIPFRELGFNGVPQRSSVLVQPTTDCLVQLTEPPFTVVTLSEIEVVHLERVQFGLKNFDMVLVMRDFQRQPIHINTIPVEALDGVKDWLDSVDIPYSEGPLNLNWFTIMKTVTADPHTFFVDGGWSFLAADSDDEDGSDEESEESAFEVSDEEIANLSEESSEDDSDFDDDASADEGSADDDMSDEGEDWDEMEKKAAKSDREGGDAEDTGRKGKKK
ncbi:hypothetical protein FH972_023982 [Carpinus fangiana]|uniref:FACT complex subunit n=1 Tax=Carpinus fangiana TaxID=176857 RepID=A0A5N6KZ74_9ROSI|nr:hypothetical protein FH972_023982 [Carpinus fangiana]